MSEIIKVCLKHNIEWMKKDYQLLVGAILVSAGICSYWHVNEVIVFLLLLVLFIKSFIFTGMYTLNPGQSDSFSWKFMQGLPLNKPDLMKLNVLSGLMVTSPILILITCYWYFLSKNLFENPHNYFLVMANIILCITLANLFFILKHIQFPRKEFQRRNAANQLIKFLRYSLSWFAFILLFAVVCVFVERHFNYDILNAIGKIFDFASGILTSWWNVPFLLLCIFLLYKRTLYVWTNEKVSYNPNKWNAKKEYSIILASSFVIALVYFNIDFNTPSLYQGDLNKLVYQKKTKEVLSYIREHGNINQKNEHGMTPMLVALREGNLEMMKLLESNGATLAGSVTDKREKTYGYDAVMFAISSPEIKVMDFLLARNFKFDSYNEKAGYFPIHLAAALCNSRKMDLLISNRADINVRNNKGETPLIVAVKNRCFASAVSLKEAGAQFDLLDKEGKTAFDRVVEKKTAASKEFQYYVEKNSRKPASN